MARGHGLVGQCLQGEAMSVTSRRTGAVKRVSPAGTLNLRLFRRHKRIMKAKGRPRSPGGAS